MTTWFDYMYYLHEFRKGQHYNYQLTLFSVHVFVLEN